MKKRSFFRHFKNKYVIGGIILLLIIIIGYKLSHGTAAPTFETAVAKVGDVIETVSVTGTISPVSKADLAFERSGAIAHIYVKVGDTVKAGDPIASLDSAQDAASLASAQATLADLSRSLTPQELAVQSAALDTAKKSALNAIHDGYAKAQGAVVNYVDAFFTNPGSPNPTIIFRTDSPSIASSINVERSSVTDALNAWSALLSSVTADTAGDSIAQIQGYLATEKSFMSDLSSIVGRLSVGNSGLTQSQIDADTSAMNSGLSALNGAIDAITSAQTTLSSAQSGYDLKLSGNSSQSIAAQAAKVAQAQAALAQDRIVSPIDGVVTKADPNVGEFVAAGQSGFAVQNSGFKIEAYVAEADIAKVAVDDLASSTLDAYGSNTDFPAKIIAIDPAETVLQGVPTYKVTLQFVTPDARIRSGMTANLEILTHESAGVVQIPYRALVITSTSTTARIVSADGQTYSFVPVTTGLKGSDGTIEIVSGIQPGDKVVTYVKQ